MNESSGPGSEGVDRRTVLRSALALGGTTIGGTIGVGTAGADGRRRRRDGAGTDDERVDTSRRDGTDDERVETSPRQAGETTSGFSGYYSTRGHFWWNTFLIQSGLEDGYSESDVDSVNVGSGLPTGDDKRAIIVVHGWQNTVAHSRERFGWVQEIVNDNRYIDPAVVGFSWPSDTDGHWYVGRNVAVANGPKLAAAIIDLRERGVEKVHLVGHSLGGLVALSALSPLHEQGGYVDSLHLLTAAVEAGAVSTDGAYGADIEAVRAAAGTGTSAQRTFNYYDPGDSVLRYGFEAAQWARAVGRVGCQGPKPAGYEDVEVSADSHYDVLRSRADGGILGTVIGRMIRVDPEFSSARFDDQFGFEFHSR